MKKLYLILLAAVVTLIFNPRPTLAAGGIFASGGGTKTEGQAFTVTVAASGASFNALQGTISVSGPVSIVSFTAGSATWMKAPANGSQFVGMTTSPVSSVTVATIKLKGTKPGSGSVSVSGAKLALSGSIVSTASSGTNFTIQRAPQLPGAISVTSSTHPDQNAAYENTTIALAWNKPTGVTGFSYLLDQTADTNPPGNVTSADTAATYENQAIGTYYFHIKGKNNDGWGAPTHFKITIKEPDPKVDESLSKPSNIKISKGRGYINNIKEGTVTNLLIAGKTEPGFTANFKITPAPTIPEGKTLSATTNSEGSFKLLIDFPITAGYHQLTVQGQKNKILTPESNIIRFEISQYQGGSIHILTDKDTNVPPPPEKKSLVAAWQSYSSTIRYGTYTLILLLVIATTLFILKKRGYFKVKDFPL